MYFLSIDIIIYTTETENSASKIYITKIVTTEPNVEHDTADQGVSCISQLVLEDPVETHYK